MHGLAVRPAPLAQLAATAACLLALGATPTDAAAQTPAAAGASIDTLRVVVWPEYDRPDALVIFKAKLAGNTALPAQVNVRIPSAVGRPHAVAQRKADGALYVAESTYAVDGDWATVTITTDTPEIQLEYYAPMMLDGNKRTFVFDWPGGGSVAQLQYEVQEPIGATNLAVVPEPAQRARRADGLVYAEGVVTDRAPAAPGRVALSYDKPDMRLTAQVLQQSQPQPPPQAAQLPPPSAAPTAAPTPAAADGGKGGTSWGMIGLLLVAAFAAGIWIGRASVADERDDQDDED